MADLDRTSGWRDSEVTGNPDASLIVTIDREWPDLKQAFEQWLDPNNFDNDRNPTDAH